jgi:hypothetical protein
MQMYQVRYFLAPREESQRRAAPAAGGAGSGTSDVAGGGALVAAADHQGIKSFERAAVAPLSSGRWRARSEKHLIQIDSKTLDLRQKRTP